MKQVSVSKGEIIIKYGDSGDEVYIVNQGSFMCFKPLFDGQELIYCQYGPGDAFGELAILYNAPRAASIRAMEDSTVFSLDR